MAGKSKGFKELLMQEKASQDKQRMMQKMKKEIESEDDKTLVLIEPEGYEKMSDIMVKFLEPYTVKLRSPQEYEKLLVIGMLAWNASLMTPEQRKEMINDAVSQTIGYAGIESQREMKEIVNELIERKEKYFSNIKRFITSYKLKNKGRDFNLSIVSSLMEGEDKNK
ncbi:hypothetical protein DSM106972_047090 [Dulcicalothrix desertica PCC 7102]|uniref:Uncharacterized protein n=1 Tax=Dulcicalothrix desertica PCC 7102 TaxID=232991 RepID=A0A433VCG5_9CYAN|nr:hypothetical protein [Dulcicalothrix desertica]RUT03795.1 hypothetical protein DSM106972_047090 [Dulcicalothrix desertica PCC 7102]TWH43796.1 hypothetical protein CAL7102_07540 [Dulcicalothrix desertica PCC 7102]